MAMLGSNPATQALLAVNGGSFHASTRWVYDFVQAELNWTTRRATSDSQHLPKDWEKRRDLMNKRIGFTALACGVTTDFVYSMDETFVWFVPMGSATTFAERGSTSVQVAGGEDKRGCTVAFTVKPSGAVLPMQLIYGGTTDASTPDGCPNGKDAAQKYVPGPIRKAANDAKHDICSTPSHWMTIATFQRWVERIVIPDYEAMCLKNQVTSGEQVAILQVDVYAVHIAREVLDWLKEHYPFLRVRYIPAGCTPVLQVLDTFVNRPFKHAIKQAFTKWLVAELREQIDEGVADTDLQLDISSVKAIRLQSLAWAMEAHTHICGMSDGIVEAYRKTGTLQALTDKAYQRRCLMSAERLFGITDREVLDTAPSDPAPTAVDARLTEDQQADDWEADDDDLPLAQVAAAMRSRQAGQPQPQLAPEDNDPVFVQADARAVEIARMTDREVAAAAAKLMEAMDADQLLQATEKLKRKRKPKQQEGQAPRKRGRPKGSKNKPKGAATAPRAVDVVEEMEKVVGEELGEAQEEEETEESQEADVPYDDSDDG